MVRFYSSPTLNRIQQSKNLVNTLRSAKSHSNLHWNIYAIWMLMNWFAIERRWCREKHHSHIQPPPKNQNHNQHGTWTLWIFTWCVDQFDVDSWFDWNYRNRPQKMMKYWQLLIEIPSINILLIALGIAYFSFNHRSRHDFLSFQLLIFVVIFPRMLQQIFILIFEIQCYNRWKRQTSRALPE